MEINLKNQKVFLMKFFSLPVNTLHGLGLPRSLSCPTAPVRDRTGQDRTRQDRTGGSLGRPSPEPICDILYHQKYEFSNALDSLI